MTATDLDDEVVVAPTTATTTTDGPALDDERFEALLRRLSEQSVVRHFDAYADISWDDPDYAVDVDDPRWHLSVDHPLGATDWYRSQPDDVQRAIALHLTVALAKRGMEFENILERGLLSFTFHHIGNDDPRFRYVYHEVAEETHHSMMFQEFVNRSGMNPAGLPWDVRLGSAWVILQARLFPPLFFFFVLGGEDPIDHVQRGTLREETDLAPVFEMIMRHHVIEEARHISFARHYLKLEVPRLGRIKRAFLSVAVPLMLGQMAGQMLALPPDLVTRYEVPHEVLREAAANRTSPTWDPASAVAKLRRLTRELGLMNPVATRLWKRQGLWADEPAAS